MKLVIQRVSEASVTIDGVCKGKIGKGFLVLLGVGAEDTREIADKLVDKLIKLRIFEDENGKTNLSLAQVNGELLVISQFTLYADCVHGNRPSFIHAGAPAMANELYEYFVSLLRAQDIPVGTGSFGADMQIALVNDGPVTVMLESDVLRKK